MFVPNVLRKIELVVFACLIAIATYFSIINGSRILWNFGVPLSLSTLIILVLNLSIFITAKLGILLIAQIDDLTIDWP